MNPRRILPLLALLMMTGCVNESREISLYRRVLDPRPASAPATAPTSAPDVLSLPRALALVNAHDERLAASGEHYLQALIEKDRAVLAFLPTATLSVNYLRQQQAPLPAAPGMAFPNFTPSPATDVVTSEHANLFNGFRDVSAVRRASASAEERKARLRSLQSAVLIETAEVYYQILRAETLSVVLENSVAVQDDRVADLANKLKAGTARAVDVSQAQAQAAGTRVALRQAQASAVRGRAVLAFLLGAPAVDSRLVDGLTLGPVPPLAEMEKQALANRQEIAAAAAATEAARRDLDAAVGQYYPSVTLDLTQFLHRETFPTESRWNSLLSINMPLFAAGQIHSDIRAAASRLRQAGLAEARARREAVESVRLAHETLLAAVANLRQLRTQEQAAAAGLRQATETAKAGVGTDLERLISQDQLLNAQVLVVSQDFASKVAYLSLLRAAGSLSLTSAPLAPPAPLARVGR